MRPACLALAPSARPQQLPPTTSRIGCQPVASYRPECCGRDDLANGYGNVSDNAWTKLPRRAWYGGLNQHSAQAGGQAELSAGLSDASEQSEAVQNSLCAEQTLLPRNSGHVRPALCASGNSPRQSEWAYYRLRLTTSLLIGRRPAVSSRHRTARWVHEAAASWRNRRHTL